MSRSKIISLNVILKTSQHRMGKTIVEPGMPTIMPKGTIHHLPIFTPIHFHPAS